VLLRLHARQTDLLHLGFYDQFTARLPQLLFRSSNGYQPQNMNGTFRPLMRDTELLKNTEGETRKLNSMRHTYATQELLAGTDIHTLSKQMGNSAAMIEKHYSKLTATMAADKLA
jgi:integrase